jgi:uncharacterized protein YggU (UPF0235/DUF167 family)
MEILVKVVPGSKKIQVAHEWKDLLTWRDIYKINLTAKPVNNQANKQLLEVIAEYFWVKKRFVSLDKGASSRLKLVRIEK